MTPIAIGDVARKGSDLHRYLELEVRRRLAERWDEVLPRIAVVETPTGRILVHINTVEPLGYADRVDIRSAVYSTLIPYSLGSSGAEVIFGSR